MQTNRKLLLNEIAVKRLDNYPERPIIIFLHDSLGCIELWRDFPERLGELTQCNVLIYDRQGYGKSCPFSYSQRDIQYMEKEADILIELLAFWQIEKAILFGHSDGGSIALIAAAMYPEKILGIITEGAHIFIEDITISGIKEIAQLYKTTGLKAKLEQYHGNKTEDMFWIWAAMWIKDEFKIWNIEHFLPSVKCPSLIIQGKDDEYGTLKQVERICTQTAGISTKLIIPDAKHTPHKETPEIILDRSTLFIKQLIGD